MHYPAPQQLPMSALISASLFSIGIGLASTAPYDAIVAIDTLGIRHADFALVLTVASVAGLVATVFLGWLSDRIGDRRILVVLTALAGACGFGLVYLMRNPAGFAIAYCLILPFGNAAFSQTFAYARVYYDGQGSKDAEFRITALRSVYAASWVLVPPLAGWMAVTSGVFDIYLVAAAAYLGCAAISLVLLRRPDARIAPPAPTPREPGTSPIATPMLVGIVGVVLINVAIRLSGTVTPLAMIGNFGGSMGDVGIASGIRALLEIPLMVLWGLAGRRFRKPTLIAAGALTFAAYMGLMTQARSVTDVYWLQVPCSIAIAALLSVPISYMQEAIRGRVGLSTSLLDVTFVVSGIVAAGLFGLLAAPGRYLDLFWVAGGLATLGAMVLLLAHNVIERPAVLTNQTE